MPRRRGCSSCPASSPRPPAASSARCRCRCSGTSVTSPTASSACTSWSSSWSPGPVHMSLFEGRTFELFALTLAISLVVSEALYRVVERPAMRLKNLRGPGRGEVDGQQDTHGQGHQQLRSGEGSRPSVERTQRTLPVEQGGARHRHAAQPADEVAGSTSPEDLRGHQSDSSARQRQPPGHHSQRHQATGGQHPRANRPRSERRLRTRSAPEPYAGRGEQHQQDATDG